MKVRNIALKYGSLGFAAVAGVANAAIDTSGVTGAMTEAGIAVGVVGAAGLLVHIGIKVYRWIKTASN